MFVNICLYLFTYVCKDWFVFVYEYLQIFISISLLVLVKVCLLTYVYISALMEFSVFLYKYFLFPLVFIIQNKRVYCLFKHTVAVINGFLWDYFLYINISFYSLILGG